MSSELIAMASRLANAPGACGFEDEVVAVAREYAQGLGEIQEDFLRNLYIYRKENKGNRPVIMLDAHTDEVGFMIHSIKPNGTLRFLPLGSWNKGSVAGIKVRVRNALGQYIPGLVASKPVHFQSAAEKASGLTELEDMVIDVGATSAQEAIESFHIRIGEPVVPIMTCEYDEEHDILFGRAFDDRVGCAVLLETLRRLEGVELPCDVVGVLSTQEEMGLRSAKVTTTRVNPDLAIAIEGCPADDTFTEPYAIQTALKKGPMFRHMDRSLICNPRFQRYVLNLAQEKGIPVQESVRKGGGNNAAAFQTEGRGCPAVVAGVPVRYVHAPNSMSAGCDMENTVRILIEILTNMTPEIIAGF